jgi:hypothetical protein
MKKAITFILSLSFILAMINLPFDHGWFGWSWAAVTGIGLAAHIAERREEKKAKRALHNL